MRGRPKGSISLSEEKHAAIIAAVCIGASPLDAAVAAGVPARTFTDWRARFDSATAGAKITQLFEDIEQAEAQARALALADTFQRYPRLWLARAPKPKIPDQTQERNPLLALHELLEESHLIYVPRICRPRCRCPWHSPRTEAEVEAAAATRSEREAKVRRLIRRGAE